MPMKGLGRRTQVSLFVVAVVMTLVSFPGLMRLDFNGEVREIFRSAGEEYRAYDEVLRLFPGIESDIVVLLSGQVTRRETLDALLRIDRALDGLEGVEHVVSLLSLPGIQEVLLDPFELTLPERVTAEQVATVAGLIQMDAPGIAPLVGEQGESQLMVIRLSREVGSADAYDAVRGAIHQSIGRSLSPAGLEYLLAGIPEMEAAIRQEAVQDTTRIIVLAVTLCTLVAWWLFRSLAILLLLGIGPCLGVVWTLGVMGRMGDDMTVFSTVLIPLLFVIGYTNAAHLVFACLRHGGEPGWGRSARALGEVLYPCSVAALTTAVGFASLVLSSSPLVSGFGLYSAIGTLLTLFAVVAATPVLMALLDIGERPGKPAESGYGLLSKFGGLVTRRPRVILVLAMLLIPPAIWASLQLEADYRIRENFSPASEFHQAVTLGDQSLSGLVASQVLIRWTPDDEPELSTLLAAEARIIEAASAMTDPERVVALSTMLPSGLSASAMTPRDLDVILPKEMLDRVLNAGAGAALVSMPLRDLGSKYHAPRLAAFSEQLQLVAADYPTLRLSLTGLGPIAVKGSLENIPEMARSLSWALLVIFLVITLVLQSLKLGLICMVPNLLPLVGVAALMSLFAIPLQFNTVLVFTICIGIAVDDTVHLVFRYRALGRSVGGTEALTQAISQVGLVLVFTSLVLGVGFLSLLVSAVDVVRLMGALGAAALALALLADLVLLPSLIMRFDAARNMAR